MWLCSLLRRTHLLSILCVSAKWWNIVQRLNGVCSAAASQKDKLMSNFVTKVRSLPPTIVPLCPMAQQTWSGTMLSLSHSKPGRDKTWLMSINTLFSWYRSAWKNKESVSLFFCHFSVHAFPLGYHMILFGIRIVWLLPLLVLCACVVYRLTGATPQFVCLKCYSLSQSCSWMWKSDKIQYSSRRQGVLFIQDTQLEGREQTSGGTEREKRGEPENNRPASWPLDTAFCIFTSLSLTFPPFLPPSVFSRMVQLCVLRQTAGTRTLKWYLCLRWKKH